MNYNRSNSKPLTPHGRPQACLKHCLWVRRVRREHFNLNRYITAWAKSRVTIWIWTKRLGFFRVFFFFVGLTWKQGKLHSNIKKKLPAEPTGTVIQFEFPISLDIDNLNVLETEARESMIKMIWKPALMLTPKVFFLSSTSPRLWKKMSVDLAKLEQHLSTRSYVEG